MFEKISGTDAWKLSEGGSWLIDEIEIAPRTLVATFGEGEESDGYKVAAEYYFKSKKTNAIFTLYDWKSTSLYDHCYVSPKTLYASTKPYDFHIGGNDKSKKEVESFKKWLLSQLVELITLTPVKKKKAVKKAESVMRVQCPNCDAYITVSGGDFGVGGNDFQTECACGQGIDVEVTVKSVR